MTTTPRRALRDRLADSQLDLVPGVTNAFFAKRAEEAGFPVLFITGGGIANTIFGVPDLGLTTMSETVTMTRHIVSAVTVQELEDAGVAGLILEDQVFPKRCGHFERKSVVPVHEMIEKLVAADRARRDPDLVIVARTDAIGTEGLSGALDRAQAYVAAGADVIYVEAPRTEEELATIPPSVSVPCLVDMVEGGLTPLLPAADLERMGFKFALYANLALRVAALAVDRAFKTLRQDGASVALIDQMLGWEERQSAVGFAEWERFDHEVAFEAQQILEKIDSAVQ